jgi:NAD(P)-dependent dehydrogenase (short-subunit alcohol dehydrogenase family)
MRVMVMVKASPESEAGQMPSEQLLAEMGRYNEELANAESELRDRATFVAAFACDLTKPAEITRLFDRIRHEVGSVDVLINNAGVIQVGPLETITHEDYEQAMAVHFWAPLLCSEQVLPEMLRDADTDVQDIQDEESEAVR